MAKTNILSPENIKTLIDAMKVVFPTTEEVIKIIDEKLDEKIKFLPTKDEFYKKMGEVMGKLQTIQDEQVLITGRVSQHSDQLEDHETRISNLEKKTATASPQS